ncbi:lysine-epsilon-oxidase maturase LodB [Alkalimonas amylolytica]|uniref:Dehydrogenase (Flavoprotein) n=1 Tax=Alkalimonas amylolytica TaxID=152573 RepID=A0A1H4BS95_ALKAM|nr:lysine-epsilon-oxidase maturase LodB [Alkalimonas amylolytica]SEA50991.1 Dehydrogenase (flavoprotein) [Alkalimonas amylolytica]
MALPRIEADVVIIGAGPAGACAALSLLTYSSLKVVLLEQSDFSQLRVGEHVSDSLFALLDYLKLSKTDFPEGSFMPCYGDTAYWGSAIPRERHSIFNSENASVQLARELFDFTLLEHILARGGTIYPRTQSKAQPLLDSAGWLLDCTHPEKAPFQIQARYLIDASGRNSTLCRQQGGKVHKLDQLMGAGCFFSCPGHGSQLQQHIIESCEDGWWYGALLPNQGYVATFFSDVDIISQQRLNQRQHWLTRLQQSRQLKYQLQGCTMLSKHPWVRNASSHYSDSSAISRYIAIGDAACAFDPISSMGLGFAITSACHAARLVMAELAQLSTTPSQSSSSARQLFQQDLRNHFSAFKQLRQKFYQAESRWTEAPFWQRRQALA